MHSDHIQWGLSDLFHLNPFITILFTNNIACAACAWEVAYKWEEKSSKSYSAHSTAAGSPKPHGDGGALNSLHQALGLRDRGCRDSRRTLGSEEGTAQMQRD